LNDAAVNVGQSKISARESVRQLGVIETHQVQHGRMQVVHMHSILNRLESNLVGRSIRLTAAYTTAC
jgi:septum formation inhibitor-activating ATPase MinD